MTEATPRPSGAIEATLLKARQYIQDTVPCQRIVHGSCSTRSCYIANGWDGVPPVAVEPRCKEFQIIADIDALVYPMEGRVNNYDEALELLREAQKLVAEREYLEQHEFYYAQGSPEPSPAEWGVSACYQQTAEAGPKDQFDFDVRDYHVGNKQEHDENSSGTMTLANRIDAFLAKEKGNG